MLKGLHAIQFSLFRHSESSWLQLGTVPACKVQQMKASTLWCSKWMHEAAKIQMHHSQTHLLDQPAALQSVPSFHLCLLPPAITYFTCLKTSSKCISCSLQYQPHMHRVTQNNSLILGIVHEDHPSKWFRHRDSTMPSHRCKLCSKQKGSKEHGEKQWNLLQTIGYSASRCHQSCVHEDHG